MVDKVDILAFGAHPDDVELNCGGTILASIAQGKKVAVVDLTRGELGTRGNTETRHEEATKAAELLGVTARHNLNLPDGFLTNDEQSKLAVVRMIRHHQPKIVITGAKSDRHPDHGMSAKIVSDACFLAGLVKIETEHEGHRQDPWRPDATYFTIQFRHRQPDFVFDITPYIDQKLAVAQAYVSQFHDPSSSEPETVLTSSSFFDKVRARAMEMGLDAGFEYGEGFEVERTPGVSDLDDLI
jgi:bacillithiol biosynthesis deacetylase BshB1